MWSSQEIIFAFIEEVLDLVKKWEHTICDAMLIISPAHGPCSSITCDLSMDILPAEQSWYVVPKAQGHSESF